MKKIAIFFFLSIVLFLISLPVRAEEAVCISEQSVPDRIYDIVVLSSDESSKTVSIDITYDEIILPPSTYFYAGSINGVDYSGTLRLIQYSFQNGQTLATYQGTVYAVN